MAPYTCKICNIKLSRSSPSVIKKHEESSKHIENNLIECPICYEIIKCDKIWDCEHSFCNSCVTKMIENKHTKCPLCRSDNVLQTINGKKIETNVQYEFNHSRKGTFRAKIIKIEGDYILLYSPYHNLKSVESLINLKTNIYNLVEYT